VLLPGPDHQVGQPSSATTTILSDDVPELTLQGGGTVGEGSLRRLTVRADTASPGPVAVALTAGGTATPGTDFTPLPATVTLPAGATSVSVDVQSLADSVVERDETVVVSIGAPAGGAYRLGPAR